MNYDLRWFVIGWRWRVESAASGFAFTKTGAKKAAVSFISRQPRQL